MERFVAILFSPGDQGGLKLKMWTAVNAAFLVALLSFPAMNPVYANGIDPPLSWVFNYLIHGHFSLGKDIIFPHGPLAFIMYPLPKGLNLITAMIINLVIRAAFAFALIRLPIVKGKTMIVAAIVSAFILLASLDLLLVVVGLVVLCYLNYERSRRVEWVMTAFLLTVAAIYVKAFVGIVCGLITVTFFLLLCYDVLKKEEKWQRLILILVPPVLLVLGWIFMYGTLQGLSRYIYGMFQLAGDNSSAVAYYPDNNWLILSIAFALLAGIIVIQRKQVTALRFFFLLAPAVFAVWKYGMAREDYLHAGLMFLFILMLAVFLVFVVEEFKLISLVAGFILTLLVFINLQNAYYYEPLKFSVSGIRNFAGLLMNYRDIADTCEVASIRNISRNVLDKEIRDRIGKSSVDIYPWDYSFIPANDLNWKPRPVLQSYACYTPWLDHENARHFCSPAAPEFIIWELRKITHDIHNGTLESIDGRYLLNDQPETVLSILSNYRLADRQGGTFPVLVFEKRKVPVRISRKIIPHPDVSWDRWIDVDSSATDILRAKVSLQRNVSGRITSFFYKDEAVFVYYLLENGEIRVYRIVSRNAEEGLWINPLIMNPENRLTEPTVKKIMFRCTNTDRMKSNIQLSWELLTIQDLEVKTPDSGRAFNIANARFGKIQSLDNNSFLKSINDLESAVNGWSVNPLPEKSEKAHSGSTSCELMGGCFSMSYERSLDSILPLGSNQSYIVKTMVWANAAQKIDGSYVISIEKDGKSLEWKSVRINDFMIEKDKWNYIFNFLVLKPELISQKGLKLKVYAWNNGKVPFLVDDLQVRVYTWVGN